MRSPVTDDGCPSPPWACRGLQARRLRLGAGLSVRVACRAPGGPRLPISRKRLTTVRTPHRIRRPLHLHGVFRSVPRRCVTSAVETLPAQVKASIGPRLSEPEPSVLPPLEIFSQLLLRPSNQRQLTRKVIISEQLQSPSLKSPPAKCQGSLDRTNPISSRRRSSEPTSWTEL
jgi:hypothetical protein